jgi:hypothetical protein
LLITVPGVKKFLTNPIGGGRLIDLGACSLAVSAGEDFRRSEYEDECERYE